jgi:hypothetical protein
MVQMDYPVALVQGIYFFITGIWPILSIQTFLLVTGPKTDLWLVKTVGIVLATIGATLVFAQLNAQVNSTGHLPGHRQRAQPDSCRSYLRSQTGHLADLPGRCVC